MHAIDSTIQLSWRTIWALAAILVPRHIVAQVDTSAAAITATDIARDLKALGTDSTPARVTPSGQLESMAQYVATQFEQAGLEPIRELAGQVNAFGIASGPISTWFQRYRIPLNCTHSSIVFMAGGRRATAGFLTDAAVSTALPTQLRSTKVLFVAGRLSLKALLDLPVDGKVVLYFPFGGHPQKNPAAAAQLFSQESGGLVYLVDEDSAAFAHFLETSTKAPIVRADEVKRWMLYVRAAAPGLAEVLSAAGVDLSRLRGDSTPIVRELPALQLAIDARNSVGTEDDTATTAPNVIGVLEGSDSALRDEYVIMTAHMDRASLAGSVSNGDASGTAGLLALARAFNRPAGRPRRSVIFVATSGGATPPFWGYRALVAAWHGDGISFVRPGPLLNVVATLDLDQLGTVGDSVMVDGLRTLELATPIEWIAAAHPELQLTVVDGGTIFRPEFSAVVFAGENAVPSLGIRTRRARSATDGPRALDAGQIARLTRLAFYVGQALTNADQAPHWSAEGRRQLLEAVRAPASRQP